MGVHGHPGAEALPGEVSRWMDGCRRGTAGRTDLLPSTYHEAPCRIEVELLMAIIVVIVSTVAPPLRSVIRSRQLLPRTEQTENSEGFDALTANPCSHGGLLGADTPAEGGESGRVNEFLSGKENGGPVRDKEFRAG